MAILLLAALALRPANTPGTPGPVDHRYIAGVVTHAGGIDVYSVRMNQHVAGPGKMWRTTIGHDGASRLSRELASEFSSFPYVFDGHVLWYGSYYEILTSPIVDGALKYPQGKRVTEHGMYPVMDCHAPECVVVYEASGKQHATLLDADGNPIGAPLELPTGFHPLRVSIDERGILFVRRTLDAVRAALVRRDGTVEYDVVVSANPNSAFAIGSNGVHDVVAFTDSKQLRAVTIGAGGTLSAPVTLLADGFAPTQVAWNGGTWLIAGVTTPNKYVAARFDGAFRPLDAQPVTGTGAPIVRTDGANFVIVWNDQPAPYLTIIRNDGRVTPPFPIDPVIRRRSVR